MKNWQDSNEYRLIQSFIRKDDEICMPEIATGAFSLVRDGLRRKVKRLGGQWEEESLRIHQYLMGTVLAKFLPKILEIEQKDNATLVHYEWIEGNTAREIREASGKQFLPCEYYYALGDFAGRLHNIRMDGQSVGTLNFWPRNVIWRPDTQEIVWIDCTKFYLSNFPECFAIKCIVAETPSVKKDQADAFLDGYRKHRVWDFKDILRQYLRMFRIYHDVYVDGELFYPGARPVPNRIEMMDLPADMSGMCVLDLGYGAGMFSMECANRGAKKVYAVNNDYKNVGPAHHRFSDIGKLMCVMAGHTEDNLCYKHMNIDTDWFVDYHIYEGLKYLPKRKWDIIFALAIADHITDPDRKKRFFKMLSDCTDCLYYESRMGGRQESEERRLRELTTFPHIEYLGNASCNQNRFTYSLFRCIR